jgi:hypothetical protein
MARLAAQGREIQDALQSVEDALMEAGYDDFLVVTQYGAFLWTRAPGN